MAFGENWKNIIKSCLRVKIKTKSGFYLDYKNNNTKGVLNGKNT